MLVEIELMNGNLGAIAAPAHKRVRVYTIYGSFRTHTHTHSRWLLNKRGQCRRNASIRQIFFAIGFLFPFTLYFRRKWVIVYTFSYTASRKTFFFSFLKNKVEFCDVGKLSRSFVLSSSVSFLNILVFSKLEIEYLRCWIFSVWSLKVTFILVAKVS